MKILIFIAYLSKFIIIYLKKKINNLPYFFYKHTENSLDIFNKFIKINSTKNKNYITKQKNKDILIVESLVRHPTYAISNCMLAVKIRKIKKIKCVGLIKRNDLKTRLIFLSYGINNFIYYDDNIFIDLFFFIKTYFKYIVKLSYGSLVNLKIKNIEFGNCVYEDYLRFSKKISNKKIDYLCCYYLSKAIKCFEFSNKILKNKNFKYFVQGETQFCPHKIFFQNFLLNKKKIFVRYGGVAGSIGMRIYDKFSSKNTNKEKISIKLTNYLLANKKVINASNKFYKESNFVNSVGHEKLFNKYKKNKLNFKDKNEFYKFLKLDKDKNTVLILPHVIIDAIMHNEWSVYFGTLNWYIETLKIIKKIKKINWIIKPHPSEYHYNSIATAEKFFLEEVKNCQNIILYPKNIHINNIHKYIDAVVTSHGSAGYQYTSLGLPVVTASDCYYSNFKFTYAPRNKEEYINILKNIDMIKKPNKKMILKSKILFYTMQNLIVFNLFKYLDITKGYSEEKIWKDQINLLKNNEKNILFEKLINNQLLYNNRQTFNYKAISSKKNYININDLKDRH